MCSTFDAETNNHIRTNTTSFINPSPYRKRFMGNHLELGIIPREFADDNLRRVLAEEGQNYFRTKFERFIARLPPPYHRVRPEAIPGDNHTLISNGKFESEYIYNFIFNHTFYDTILRTTEMTDEEYASYETALCRDPHYRIFFQFTPPHALDLVRTVLREVINDFLFLDKDFGEHGKHPHLFEITPKQNIRSDSKDILARVNQNRPPNEQIALPRYDPPDRLIARGSAEALLGMYAYAGRRVGEA